MGKCFKVTAALFCLPEQVRTLGQVTYHHNLNVTCLEDGIGKVLACIHGKYNATRKVTKEVNVKITTRVPYNLQAECEDDVIEPYDLSSANFLEFQYMILYPDDYSEIWESNLGPNIFLGLIN